MSIRFTIFIGKLASELDLIGYDLDSKRVSHRTSVIFYLNGMDTSIVNINHAFGKNILPFEKNRKNSLFHKISPTRLR